MAMEEDKFRSLLISPTFIELGNGRFKCVETGHELPAKDIDSYGLTKRCRLGLIDFALSHNKPPLNLFKQDPLSRLKLVCKLTGDIVNKSEEHIWKHMNGKRFLTKLVQKEAEKMISSENMVEKHEVKLNRKKKKMIKEEKEMSEIISEVRDSGDQDSDAEEADFWMPPEGNCRGSGSDSELDDEEDNIDEERAAESEELSNMTKRMSIEVGPSSYASRKKKTKTDYLAGRR